MGNLCDKCMSDLNYRPFKAWEHNYGSNTSLEFSFKSSITSHYCKDCIARQAAFLKKSFAECLDFAVQVINSSKERGE